MNRVNDRDRFDRFTERARKVLSLAQEEAQRFQHNYIGTEHLLLGLVREGEGVAARVLESMGAELYKVRQAVEFIIGRGDRIVLGEIGLTPRAKKVIELAVDEARRLNHHYIGTEHLLLGLVREGEGIAAGVLESFGIQLEQVRKSTLDMLAQLGKAARGETETEAETSEIPDTPTGFSYAPVEPPLSMPDTSSERDRFDRFTERARKVLSLAQEEARRLQHNYMGTEHLLLGLVAEGEGVAAKVLNRLGVELSKVRSTVEQILRRREHVEETGAIGLTPRAKKVIELAVDEARRLNHHYIGTEHLLLGLVREGEGVAAGALESLGVTLHKVRLHTIAILSRSAMGTEYPYWIVDENAIFLTSEEIAHAHDEDDLTRAPAREESDEKSIPGDFTVRARRVLDAAQEEANNRQQTFIDTEHLLLGLIREEKGLAALFFQKLGSGREAIRATVEFVIVQSGSRAVPDVAGYTPLSRHVLRRAINEAYSLGQTLVGPEHLLLALLREGEGIAAGVLISLGLTYRKVYEALAGRRGQP